MFDFCLATVLISITIPSLTAKEAESPENTGFQPLFTHQKCVQSSLKTSMKCAE